jgi:hypothetical protein
MTPASETAMSRYILFVMTRPVEGCEAEYNQWQDNRHLADICAIPGVTGARRFTAEALGSTLPPHPFATVYELDVADPATVMAAIQAGAADGSIPVSDALDKSASILWLFKAYGAD